MKICNSCGASNEDSTRFCTNCGAAFPAAAPAPAPEPVSSTYDEEPATSQSYESSYQSANQTSYQSAYQPTYQRVGNTYEGEPTTSALAITGFVIGIVSIFCCGVTSIIGLIFSIAGTIAASKKTKKGLGFGIAGLVINGLLTLFIVFSLIVTGSAFQAAWEDSDSGDVQEFLENLQSELDEMEYEQSGGRSSSSRSSGSLRDRNNDDDDDDVDDDDNDDDDTQSFSSDWVDCEVSADMTTIEIIYTNGLPDDFEFCGADFDEICDVLEDNLTVEDNFGQTQRFDREEFRRLLSMVIISSDEYDRMNLSRSQVLDMLSYLATLSYEMDHDGFEPDRAVYTEATDVYDFYGIIEPNNIGHAVVVFTDGTDSYYFDEAMCGDEICWSVVPGTYDVFRIGMTADSLNEYPAGGFAEFTSWVSSILDPVI